MLQEPWNSGAFKAIFHWQGSQNRSHKWSRKSAYDLVKIKKQSRKGSHKRNRIRARRIRTFQFLPTPKLGSMQSVSC